MIIKVERELILVEEIAKAVSTNSQYTPGKTEESFYTAFDLCRVQFSRLSQTTRLSQTSFINGVQRYFRETIMINLSDHRLNSCGPLLGVSHLSMKKGRENILSLFSQYSLDES